MIVRVLAACAILDPRAAIADGVPGCSSLGAGLAIDSPAAAPLRSLQTKKARRLGRRAFTSGRLRYFFFFFAAAFFFGAAFLAATFFFAAFLAAGMCASRTVYGHLRQRPPLAISRPQPIVANLVEKHKM